MGHPEKGNCIGNTFRAMEKFGKVYLSNEIDQTDLHCLEDARFSVVDFKWYNSKGLVVPLYEPYAQNFFDMQFSMKNYDLKRRMVEFTGKFRSCFPLGKMLPIKWTDMECAETACQSWIVSTGMISEHNKEKMDRCKNIFSGYLSVAFTPSLTIEQRKLTVMYNTFLFVLDDWILEMGSPSFAKLLQITNAMASVVRGSTSWQEEDSEDPDGLRPVLRALQDIREEALRHAKEEKARYFFEALCEHLHSFSVESCVEWKDMQSKQPVLFRNAQPNLRHLTVGIMAFLEMVAISKGILLENDIRQCFIFQQFCRLVTQQMHMVNDVFSFQKEMNDKETCNHTILLHVVDELPLEVALERTFNEINSQISQILALGQMLENLFPHYPHVASFVNVAKQAIQGHYFYFQFAPRYGHDLTYDCVINSD